MYGKKELFDVFNEGFKDSVKLENDASLQAWKYKERAIFEWR
jgi:hypothetical protein